MAAQTGQVIMLKKLLELVNVCDESEPSKTTPLHCAVRAGQIESVETLLAKEADPMKQDAWGRTCKYATYYEKTSERTTMKGIPIKRKLLSFPGYDIVPEKNVAGIKQLLSGFQRK